MKIFFLLILISCLSGIGQSQRLEDLPPLISKMDNKDTSALLLNTLDFSLAEHQYSRKTYSHSIQIVDASNPWPPIWYMAKPVYSYQMYKIDSGGKNRVRAMDFIENPEISKGYIMYLQIFSLNETYDTSKIFDVQHRAVKGVLDSKLNLIDSIACGKLWGGDYGEGFDDNKQIQIATVERKDTIIDWRKISMNELDSMVHCEYGIIRVVDTKGNLIFEWNPIGNVNYESSLSIAKKKLGEIDKTDFFRTIKWLRLFTLSWTYDGNILYGIEKMGIGKVNRESSEIVWQLNFGDVLPGEFQCFSPYDLRTIYQDSEREVYSFYEQGGPSGLARGVVFEHNKKSNEIKLVRYLNPHKNYWTSGHGGFDYDYKNGNYVLDYGTFEHPESNSNFWDAFEYGRNDSVFSIYQIPKYNYIFGAHRLEDFPRPTRPVIKRDGSYLKVEGMLNGWVWYKLAGQDLTSVSKVAEGAKIKAVKGVFCVVGSYGAGYYVSLPFYVK